MTKPKPKVFNIQKPSVPDFVNFGDDFDFKKFKMENVNVDGEEFSYDSEKENKDTQPNSENIDTVDESSKEDLQSSFI